MRRRAGGRRCGACGRGRTYPRTREAPGPDRGALRPLREELAGLGLRLTGFGAVCEARQAWSRCLEDQTGTGAETRKRGPGACVRRELDASRVERREAPAFS